MPEVSLLALQAINVSMHNDRRETSGVPPFQRRTANGIFCQVWRKCPVYGWGPACEPPVSTEPPMHSHYLHGLNMRTFQPFRQAIAVLVRRPAKSGHEDDHRIISRMFETFRSIADWGRAFVVAIDKNEIPLCSRQSCDFSNSSGLAVAYS